MSCSTCATCSTAAITCNNASFSMPLPSYCPLTSMNPPIPAHYFNLYCGTYCPPVIAGYSPNHGISCNAYNGYNPPMCVLQPGHCPSCAACSTLCPTPINCK